MGKLYSGVSKLALVVSASVSWFSNQAAAEDLPQGGAVVSGGASFNQSSPGNLTIDQSTENAIIHWGSFDIGAANAVHFNQPGPASATLNRVTGDTASSIAGQLTATGSVLLVNPNGIAIHNGAIIDTGGFIASSLDIADADFLSGNLTFRNGGDAGLVSNAGTIRVAPGGNVALIGGQIRNEGLVEARLGRVAFAAGDLVTVDFSGDGFLSVGVKEDDLAAALGAPGASLNALIEAGGIVRADGGRILISSSAAAGLMLNAVNVPGDMIARSVTMADGRVVLGGVNIDGGGGDVRLTGLVDVSGSAGAGAGAIDIATSGGGLLTSIGVLNATGASHGGAIHLHGGAVALGGLISADGAEGGAVNVTSERMLSLAELVSARGLFGAGGSISYNAGSGVIETTTSVSDVSGLIQGGAITINAGADIFSSGTYRAASAQGLGGAIDVTAPNVSLFSARFDASGRARGGLVRIGGAFRGGAPGQGALYDGFENRFGALAPLAAANTVFLNDSTSIDVSSAAGAGGAAVLWSTDQTTMLAGIDARGASAGGFVEISSAGVLRQTDLAGVNVGAGGTLLLDPKNIVIGDLVAAADWQYAGLIDGSIAGFGGSIPTDHEFGRALALNDDGTLLAMGVRGNNGFTGTRFGVGAVHLFSFADSNFGGAAYVGTIGVDYSGGNHVPVFLNDLDHFGTSVALNAAGDRLAVGAPWSNSDISIDSGSVSLFSFGDNTDFTGGSQVGYMAVDPFNVGDYDTVGFVDSNDLFGTGLALNAAGDRLAVGAALDDGFGASGFLEYGAVHLFTFDDVNFTNPTHVGSIGHGYTGANDVNLDTFLNVGDQFGTSVSLNAGANLLAGGSHSDQGFFDTAANGAVLLFTFGSGDFTGGGHVGTIGRGYTGANDIDTTGYIADGSIFGFDVDLNAAGDRLVVAAPFDNGFGGASFHSGAVRIYDFTQENFGGGSLVSTFGYGYTGDGDIDLSVGGHIGANHNFGHAVDVTGSGDRIAAGFRGGSNGGGAMFFTSEPSALTNLLFSNNQTGTSYISVANLAAALSTGASVVFEASNDIDLLADLLVDHAGGDGGDLSLFAGRRINIAANIFSDNGNVSLYANTHNGDDVTVNANREVGLAHISMGAGNSINAGSGQVVIGLMSGAGLTDPSSGDVTLGSITASRIEVFNAGPTAGSDIQILSGAALTASGLDRAIELRAETGAFINSAGAGGLVLTGGGHYGIFSDDPLTTTEGVSGYLKRYNVANALAFDAIDPGSNYFAYRIAPVLTVAAQNAGRIYGDPNPLFAAQITGFIDGDTELSSLTGAPSLTTIAGPSSNVGPYAIIAGQGGLASAEGYQFQFVNGQLTVSPRAITITADDLDKIYGEADPTLTVSVGGLGLAGGDTPATALSGSASRSLGENVTGSPYVISPNGVTATANYSVTYEAGAFTITPRPITISADNLGKIYGNADPALTVSVGGMGLANGDTQISTFTGVAQRAAGEDVATYAIDPTGVNAGSNYSVTYVDGIFSITPRAITITADDLAKIYGDVDPSLTVSVGGMGLANGDTPETALSGTATRALGENVTGSPYVISPNGVTATANYLVTYEAGAFTITPRPITITADDLGKIYGNLDPALTVSVGGSGLANGDTQGSTFTGVAQRAAGEDVSTYAIDPSFVDAGSNYSVTYVNGTFSITPRAITITADDLAKIYGEADPTLTVSVGGMGLANGDTQLSTFTGAATRALGENVTGSPYVIDASGIDAGANYTVTYVDGAFTITPRPITITADNLGKIYGNTDPALTVSVGGMGLANGDTQVSTFTGVAQRAGGENATTYAIDPSSVNAGANYSVTYVGGVFTITPRAITITADDLGKIYGNVDPALTVSVGGMGLANGDTQGSTFTGVAQRAAGENATTYAIDPSFVDAGSNYAVTYVDGTFTIAPRAITITADDLFKIYGNADPALTVSVGGMGLANGDTQLSAFTGAAQRAPGEAVATYAIDPSSVSAGANYAVTYVDGVFTITPREITITADDLAKIYGNVDPTLTVSVSGDGLANGDTLVSTFTGAPTRAAGENAGVYVIDASTVDAGANYVVTFVNGEFTITPRAITITADDLAKIYGEADPSLTVSVGGMGLANGDTPGSAFTGAAVRAAGENAGAYAIDASGISAGANYAVTYVDGAFTITPRAITITADDLAKIYGNADPALTVTIGGMGLVGSDTLSGAAVRAAGENVGAYSIDASGISAGANYDVAYVGGELTITPRAITINADDLAKIYGEADPSMTVSVGGLGLANGDTLNGAPTRAAGENVGAYAIDASGVTASANYDVTYANGQLTITPRPITVTLDDLQKRLGEGDPALTYALTSGNLVFGDLLTGAPTRQPGEQGGAQYAITGGTLMAGGNYLLTIVNGVLTIIPAPDTSPSQTTPNSEGVQASQNVNFDLTGENSPTGVLSFNTAAGQSSTSDVGAENCLASQAGVCVVAQ